MASGNRKIVVTGATGKQGGALISALVAKPDQPFEIYAVTRDKTSRGAQALAQKPNVKVIEGDFKAPEAIFQQVEKPWGLFSVSMPGLWNPQSEESQGKAMTAAALSAGISHIVYTSVDRGRNTPNDPTPVPHFRTKHNVEKDLIFLAQSNPSLTYTFLQPVCFMDNLAPNFGGKIFNSVWSLNGLDSKLQMVAVPDIGKVGAEAFLNADKDGYKNQRIPIAGDELTPTEAKKIFTEVTGEVWPETYSLLAWIVRTLIRELGIMFNWFKSDGYGVNIPELKRRHPYIKDFRTWLQEDSGWAKKSK